MGNLPTTGGKRRRWWLLAVGVLAIGASGASGYKLADHGRGAAASAARAWRGKVAKIVHGGGASEGASGITAETSSGRVALVQGGEVGPGVKIATDARTQARIDFDDGSSILIDRATSLTLGGEPRTMRLEDGVLIADLVMIDGAEGCTITTPNGELRVGGGGAKDPLANANAAKLTMTATDTRTSVEMLRGEAELRDAGGAMVRIASGEEGVVSKGARLEVSAANDLGQRVSFGGNLAEGRDHHFGNLAQHNEDAEAPVSGLGELRARRPGSKDEKDHAVRLARHDVKVRIVGNVARTEIDETFANDTDQELEGLYRFPLPPGALIERLALEVEGKLVDGSFVEKGRAAAIWRGVIQNATPLAPRPKEELIWVPGPWRDPALLEWQRGGRSELKIFPIPKRGARRIVLAYTEMIQPVGGLRRYVYALPQSAASDMKIDRASFDVQVLGADASVPPRVRGYELGAAGEGGNRFTKTIEAFTPSGDLGVEYALADRTSDATSWAFSDAASSGAAKAEDPYVAIALRPKLPRWGDATARDQVIVIDAGRGMFGERFQRAARLAVQMTQEMDRRDRVNVLVCDVTCRALPGGFKGPGSGAAHDVDAFLAGIVPDGASDLVGAVRAAGSVADRDAKRSLRVVLVSTGVASAGYRRADRVATEVAVALPDARAEVVTVPIGTDADVDTLREIARGGGGVLVPYQPGDKLETAALEVLNATYGITLRDVELTLPEGLYDVAPGRLAPMRAGGETIVAARMRGGSTANIKGDAILRGKVAGQPFEARYALDMKSTAAEGNAFVPRIYAALRIADKERDGDAGDGALKKELVLLSQRYAVPSKFTSLLVLESEAMFSAFGIDRSARASSFSGEVNADASATSATPGAAGGDDPLATREKSGDKEKNEKKDERHAFNDVDTGARGGGLSGFSAGPASKAAQAEPKPMAPPSPPQSSPAPMTSPTATAAAPIMPLEPPRDEAAQRRAWGPPRRPGRWMKRVFFRTAAIAADERPVVAADKILAARAALQAAPDERRRSLDLVRLLSRNGMMVEMAEVVARWSTRDPLDADAIAARADLLARTGDRAAALRVLGGIAASATGSDAAQVLASLGLAHERANATTEACAFRVASAELRPSDVESVAAAVACERGLGHVASAERWLASAKSEALRAATAAAATKLEASVRGVASQGVFGDVVVDATWDGADGADLDLAIVDPTGTRVSWASRARNMRAADCTSRSHEALAIASFATGAFVIEVVRTGAAGATVGATAVRGTLRITSQGQTRIVPFVAGGARAQVARVDVGMDSRLVAANPEEIGARLAF